MRVGVIGSRSVDDRFYGQLCRLMPRGVSEVVSGGARGADALGKKYALENELKYTEFAPDYAKYGRRATLKRNEEIAEYSDYVIALWDGTSRGTAHTVAACIKSYTEVRGVICK